jgi:ABC-type sulfate transport system substrate-binding protein
MEQLPNSQKKSRTGWAVVLFCLVILLLISYAPKWGAAPDEQEGIQLIVYAFSTQEEVFTQGIFPAFDRQWRSNHATNISVSGVFAPSGTLAGQISLGAPADVAVLSNVNQLNYLIISRSIKKDAQPVYFGASPVVIVTRPGNPAAITGFEDLGQDDLVIIHGDPRSSGVGEWSLLAEYGSCFLKTGDQAAALAQIEKIWRNVRLIAPSARSALTLFELGAGDALITYEQDARLAAERGVALEIVMPSPTILTEPVAVAVDSNITRTEQEAVDSFLSFLTGVEAQRIFTSYYLRTTTPEITDRFPPADTFNAADLGGWPTIYSQMLKPYWEEHIYPGLSLFEDSTLVTPE